MPSKQLGIYYKLPIYNELRQSARVFQRKNVSKLRKNCAAFLQFPKRFTKLLQDNKKSPVQKLRRAFNF